MGINAEYMGTSVRTSPSERTASQNPTLKMAELGLKKKEIDAINFAFDVYVFKGDGKVDAFYAGDLIRACNLNPTLKTIKEIGGAAPRERSSCPSPMSSPCTRPARTPRTRVASTTSLRRCALLRSKRFTLSLSSEYKKPPNFHQNIRSNPMSRAEHLAKTELIPVKHSETEVAR